MDTTSQTQTAPDTDSFELIVRDIIVDFFAGEADRASATEVITAIMDAYKPRMKAAAQIALDARQGTLEAHQAAAAYAAMDRAQQDTLRHVRDIVGHLVVTSAQQARYINDLSQIRDGVRHLTAKAFEDDTPTVTVAQLNRVLSVDHDFQDLSQIPVPVSFTTDQRFCAGHFTQYDRHITLPFMGWSMVVHSTADAHALEAAFLWTDGRLKTISQLQQLDIEFQRFS